MIFDSYEFALFFIIVYGVYLCLRQNGQNWFLLAASYFFYGFWSWKFLGLLIATQVIDFHIGKALERLKDPARRKRLMTLSVLTNLGTLGFFKYFNFFTENLEHTLRFFNLPVSEVTLNIVLPVGISFYTIQELNYVYDIYKGRTRAVNSFRDFSLFVSFFPQLMAGPIERAQRLMPQIQNARAITWEGISKGGWLIAWGLFKKMFVADRLALLTDTIFTDPAGASGPMVALGAATFMLQIYADFSGYSDMAAGMGRLMGFKLVYNFNLPFASLTPSDFWRRWHISLTECLRDNIYIPMGGNRKGFSRELLAIMATMTLGGLWHGAQWNFIFWGVYCGILLVAERILRKTYLGARLFEVDEQSNVVRRFVHIVIMFALTCWGGILFRAGSLRNALEMMGNIFNDWHMVWTMTPQAKELAICLSLFAVYQFCHYATKDRFFVFRLPVPVRAAFYIAIYLHLTMGAPYDARPFVYFQF